MQTLLGMGVVKIEADIKFNPRNNFDLLDNTKTQADINKAKYELGFVPQISIDRGLEMYIEWYKDYYELA